MTLKRVIIFSVCVNVLLGSFVFWLANQHGAESGIIAPDSASNIPSPTEIQEENPVIVAINEAFHWSEVEAADYKVYRDNLRAIGCPEQTVRDIITADLDSYFDERVKELVNGVSRRFWEMIVNGGTAEKEVEEKMRDLGKLEREKEGILRFLFEDSVPPPRRTREADGLETQYSFLSAEKIAALQEIEAEAEKALEEWRRENPSASNEENADWDLVLKSRKYQKLQALLSPEEYAEYQLRNSSFARLRYQLADLDITEQEMRAVALLAHNSAGSDEFKSLLGSERFAAYERAQDASYQQTVRITDRYDLPSEKAVEIYEMQRAATAQAEAIRADSQRTAEERQALLQEIQSETERSITAALGPKVFKTYQKYNGGWLSTLGQTQKAAE